MLRLLPRSQPYGGDSYLPARAPASPAGGGGGLGRGGARRELTSVALTVAALGLAVFDFGSKLAGDSLFPGGPLDEVAHLLTTLLVPWALGPRACQAFQVPALFASVLIDVDHVPTRLGWRELTRGQRAPTPTRS